MIHYWRLLKQTISEWQEDDVSRLAAALAYFTAMSVAPLSLLVIVIAGFLWGGEQAARAELLSYVKSVIGPDGAQFVDMVVSNADKPTFGSIAGVVSIATLIWGATNVFTQMQTTLNAIWDASPDGNGIIHTMKQRFLSFAMVVVMSFVLLVSLAFSTGINAAVTSVQTTLPGVEWLWQVLNFVFSLLATTLIFAAVFKVLPDVDIAWGDVWIGAALTALLFSLGKFLLSLYLAQIGSSYGAAGSLIAFLLWVYYSAQIVFFGAEFTQVYAGQRGRSHASQDSQDSDAAKHYSVHSRSDGVLDT